MSKRFILFSILLNLFFTVLIGDPANIQNPKILILIIASEDKPVYRKEIDIWRSYMHSMPHNIDAYFIKGDPNISTDYLFDNDTIYCKTHENYTPGILNKTLLSIKACEGKLKKEYDFILRTNLSSFFIFPKLIEYCSTIPSKNCFCGTIGYLKQNPKKEPFIGGACMILSSDVALFLINHFDKLYNLTSNYYDDVLVSKFLISKNIHPFSSPAFEILTLESFLENRSKIPRNTFYIRCKNSDDSLRGSDEIFVLEGLKNMFYSK